MKREWTVRAYRSGDEWGMLELANATAEVVYDSEAWMRWWKWKYMDNPAGSAMTWLAEHNGKIGGK